MGAGAAAVLLLGPLVVDAIRYHASEAAVNQVMGGDVAGLVRVAPVSILAGVLVWRRHIARQSWRSDPPSMPLHV